MDKLLPGILIVFALLIGNLYIQDDNSSIKGDIGQIKSDMVYIKNNDKYFQQKIKNMKDNSAELLEVNLEVKDIREEIYKLNGGCTGYTTRVELNKADDISSDTSVMYMKDNGEYKHTYIKTKKIYYNKTLCIEGDIEYELGKMNL